VHPRSHEPRRADLRCPSSAIGWLRLARRRRTSPMPGRRANRLTRPPLNTSSCIPLAREAQSAAVGCQWSRSASSSSRLAQSLLELPYLSSCISWAFPGCWFPPAEQQHHQSTHPRSRRLPLLPSCRAPSPAGPSDIPPS
jgi:hypothetical protein